MAKLLLNRAALAAKLEISETRVQQYTNSGILIRQKGGYDLADSALALLAYTRRDTSATAARTRRVIAGAVLNERRARQALRQLATIQELRAVFFATYGELHNALQAGSSRAFYELAAEVDEPKARALTYVVYTAMLAVANDFRDAAARACVEIAQGLHMAQRLDRVVEELRQAVSGDDDEGD